MPGYYEDLSGDSSDGEQSQSDDDDDFFLTEDPGSGAACSTVTSSRSSSRVIIFADVDCFYCQCETIDRGLDPDRPFAIGQKHIIVTCNYAARKLGLTKLMNRDDAYRLCPHLLIIEGSDLERYRVHSRKIYECFRRACQELLPPASAVCKGSMDEMSAECHPNFSVCKIDETSLSQIYVQGDQEQDTVVLTEDQSGASAVVVAGGAGTSERSLGEDTVSLQRLLQTAAVALKIRQAIMDESGFTTTLGISHNPLLAKLASGLRKPGKVNVLPLRAGCGLVDGMPLRKVPGIGHGTMKALVPCLVETHGHKRDSSPWFCRDLLQVPRTAVMKCLEQMNGGEKSSIRIAEHCATLFQLCSGKDESRVVDDLGGIPKTLSVENSFRRGTIVSKDNVLSVMEDLYSRLPRLLKNRTVWSTDRPNAYPTTIRLTVRKVVKHTSGNRRRPFETHSQQMAFDGRSLLRENDVAKQAKMVCQFVSPLLSSLVFSSGAINITRINIGLVNFQDVPSSPDTKGPTISHRTVRPDRGSKHKSVPPVGSASHLPTKRQSLSGIDPDILSQLPADIAAEVIQSQKKKSPKRKQRIDHFFAVKR